jgi:hypothetical protein
MMRNPTIAISIFTLALCGAAPPPERPTGTNIPGGQTSSPVQTTGVPADWANPDLAPPPEARLMARTFANCIVRMWPVAAATVILNDLPNDIIIKKYSTLRDPRCLFEAEKSGRGVMLSFPGDSFRFVVAEALVNAQLPQPIAQVSAIAPLQHRAHDPNKFVPKPRKRYRQKELELLQRAKLIDEGQAFARRFGECAVRADPVNAHRLLFTQPESAEETAAITALIPKARRCIPTGEKLEVNRAIMRGTIAVSYYRLARAPRVAAPQVAKQ